MIESARTPALLLGLHAATILLSAALLFLLQPMFARMALPLLGGSPQVWNTCMVFFQVTLLAGYGYSHWLDRRRIGIVYQKSGSSSAPHCRLNR